MKRFTAAAPISKEVEGLIKYMDEHGLRIELTRHGFVISHDGREALIMDSDNGTEVEHFPYSFEYKLIDFGSIFHEA